MEDASGNYHERLDADERRVQTVVGELLKAVHEGTLHTNQTMIDALGLEGVSPAITNEYATDLLHVAVEAFQAAQSQPELLMTAEGYALAAAAFGHATQAVQAQGVEVVPSGRQNLKNQLSEYQKLAAHNDPAQRALFEAASKVTQVAYGKPLAPAARTVSEASEVHGDVQKTQDPKRHKLATAGRFAAAIAGATVVVAGSAQMASAATHAATEKLVSPPGNASSNPADLATIAAKAVPRAYTASPKEVSTKAASSNDSVVSERANASHGVSDQLSSPQSTTAPSASPTQAASQPDLPAEKHDLPASAMSNERPANVTDTTTAKAPAPMSPSEHQADTSAAPAPSLDQQAQEPSMMDGAHQVDLGSIGRPPMQAPTPDASIAKPAVQASVPAVKAKPFDGDPTVDLRDIEHTRPGDAPHPVRLNSPDAQATPDLGQIAATLKRAAPQEYVPAPPMASPAVPSPDQQSAPTPADAAPAPEAQKPRSEQQDYSIAAQKLIDQGGRWGRIGQAMKFFMEDPDLHFTPSQAAGFVGNLLGEGSELDPTMHQVGGPAFGIAQWEAGRLAALKEFDGDKYDQLDVQLQFIKHELLTSERGSLNQLRKVTNDRKAAASIAVNVYERPSVPREAERRAYADSVGDAFNAQYQQVLASHNVAPAARMVLGTEIKTIFNQCDPAWGDIHVNGIRTCDMGCGPTDVAMIVNALTNDANITPKDVYDYVTSQGLWLPHGQGTSYDGVIAAAQHWGIQGHQLGNDALKNIDTYRMILSNGGLIMVAGKGPAGNVGASLPFVSSDVGAHFIIIRGMDQNGNFLITDSYPKTRDTNTTAWSASELLSKVFGAVAYTK